MKLRTILLSAAAALLTAALAAQAQVPGINSTLNTVFTLAYDNSTMKPTYSATVAGVAAVASQSDMCTLQGSATKTLKVRRIFFTNVPPALAVTEPISVVKRSTANSGAGSAIPTVSYDSINDATTTGRAEIWTAAPTVGTLVGVLTDIPASFAIASGANVPVLFEYGRLGQPVVLRGVAQSVSVNLSGITLTGVVGCSFEYTEE